LKIVDFEKYLKSLFLICFIPTGIGLADTFNGTGISNEPELSGGTVIDFSNGAGTSGTYTEGNVTFSSEDGGAIRIEAHYNYNTSGHYLQNNCQETGYCNASQISDSLKFSFSSAVSVFGFNWGASDRNWVLKAYDSSNALIETYNLPVTRSANNGGYVGISSDSEVISYATLIEASTADSNDWILIDNFTYLGGASDDGDATFTITGSTYAGKVLTASLSNSDPDGDGTFSYQWQSSTDGTTWTSISGATSSTYTLTESEEGKYIRVSISYTDGESYSESIFVAIQGLIPQLHTEWVQPYAAMQNLGLKSIHNNRDLVLAKAGKCNNYGWVIGDSDYCAYTNANNSISNVEGDSTKGSYETTSFNSSLNLEKTINAKWKAGIAYGVGSSNLNGYDFSNTTASLSSTNTHYSIYAVKKVSDKFTLKGIIGGSDFDYKGERNYSTTSATSSYDSDGYTAEINGSWDIKKTIKNTKTPICLQPSFGVAYAAHTQDGFSESGSGDLITIDPNQAESLLFKTGIAVDKQILMEGGKWLLVPSIALNYEVDAYAYSGHRGLKGSLTESSTASTRVSAKNMGEQTGSVKVGADFVVTKDLMFNLNAKYGLADGGDEQSYGGGFRFVF